MFQAVRKIGFVSLAVVTTTLVLTPKANAGWKEKTFEFFGEWAVESAVEFVIENPPVFNVPYREAGGDYIQPNYGSPFPRLPAPDYRVNPPISDIQQHCQIFGGC
jgi:hypothetical protein